MNKKRIALLTIAALIITLLAGCGGGTKETTKETAKDTQSEETTAGKTKAAGETKAADSGKKIAMIANAPIADGGWNSSCYQAMVDAAAEFGYETGYVENVAQSDYATMFREYAGMGYNVIFAPGNEFTDAVMEVAPDFPDTSFVLLNGFVEGVGNITNVMPDANQIGQLAGSLAALQTKTNCIGFIGGMEIDTTMIKLDAFESAAKIVNPDVQIFSAFAGSYDDGAKGKEIALSMVTTSDVDVIYGDASVVDTGAREGLAEHENRWSIGQPSDIVDQNPDLIICSVCADTAALLKICIEDYNNGEFGGKTVQGTLENEGLYIGKFGNGIDTETQNAYLEVVEQIKNGTFGK